jgi:hypothetical protein
LVLKATVYDGGHPLNSHTALSEIGGEDHTPAPTDGERALLLAGREASVECEDVHIY